VPPDPFNVLVSVGITVVALALGGLSLLAYRRERERRMGVVAVAYALFALRGVLVLGEEVVDPFLRGGYAVGPELVAHLSGLAVLIALVLFFVAVLGE